MKRAIITLFLAGLLGVSAANADQSPKACPDLADPSHPDISTQWNVLGNPFGYHTFNKAVMQRGSLHPASTFGTSCQYDDGALLLSYNGGYTVCGTARDWYPCKGDWHPAGFDIYTCTTSSENCQFSQ